MASIHKAWVLWVLVVAGCRSQSPTGGGPQPPTVVEENARRGDTGWEVEDFRAGGPDFQMYVRPLSATAGERVDVQVSHPTATSVSWSVYRLGHYGGAGGRRILEGTATVGVQPPPVIEPTNGLLECRWSTNFSIQVGSDWRSGVYLARVAAPDGSARYAPFIVRDDRKADVLVVMPTATDAAYNSWGGESLYLDTRFNFPSRHAWAVSYDRPFELEGGGGFFLYSSVPTARYLEANGYDVGYLADHDVARTPSPLARARVILVLGHNEYWSRAMRDHYDAARDAGKTLGFLGANIGYWQVRFAPAEDGMPDRRMIGYKEDAQLDPVQTIENTGAFAKPPINRPENALLGIATVSFHMVDFPWVVKNAGHWLYAGTGAKEGDLWPAVVGIEERRADRQRADPGRRQRRGQLADDRWERRPRSARRRRPSMRPPRAAPCYPWARSASARGWPGPRRRWGRSGSSAICSRMPASRPGCPRTPSAPPTASTPRTPPGRRGRWRRSRAGRMPPGSRTARALRRDSTRRWASRWRPMGRSSVADAFNRRVRRIAPDAAHTVTTLAGTGASGRHRRAFCERHVHEPLWAWPWRRMAPCT